MAELTSKERLRPCLLDRLTDENPGREKESREDRVIPMWKFRQNVLRDLSWLLNSRAHPERDMLNDYPQARSSVLNYGIPDITGATIGNISVMDFERAVREAILHYEPRILGHTLVVRMNVDSSDMGHRTLSFEIEGEVWAEPMPDHLYVKTELDLDTGDCSVKEQS